MTKPADTPQTKHIVISKIKSILALGLNADDCADKIYYEVILEVKDQLRDEYERLFFANEPMQ